MWIWQASVTFKLNYSWDDEVSRGMKFVTYCAQLVTLCLYHVMQCVILPFLNLKPQKILRISLRIFVLAFFHLIFDIFQKHSFADVLQNSGSEKLRKFHWKTFVLKACNFHKKRFQYRCFSVKFVKFLSSPFLTEHLWWLLLISLSIIIYVVTLFKYFTVLCRNCCRCCYFI